MSDTVSEKKYQDEHILVCLSSSPSNAKVILYAAQMKASLDARLTAVYVQSPSPYYGTSSQDAERLKQNADLARANGADVKYIKGDDIAFQISQFAEANGITRIVIGRSMHRSGKWLKRSLLDQILRYVSDIAIDIIPDKDMKTYSLNRLGGLFGFSWMDLLKSLAVFAAVTLIGEVFYLSHFSEANIIMVFILGAVVLSLVTEYQIYSLISSTASVVLYNFLFTEPRFTLFVYETGYPFTFLVMFLVSFITSTLAVRLKYTAKQSAETVNRTMILLDTNKMLDLAATEDEIINTTLTQIRKLLKREVLYTKGRQEIDQKYLNLPVRMNGVDIGCFSVDIEDKPLDTDEMNIAQSIVSECSLALTNMFNRHAREQAESAVQNEKYRANLLRTISHDLRTPLTGIYGNASNLLSNGDQIDPGIRNEMYQDMFDDSSWLIGLVENLLSVSRMNQEEVRLQIQIEEIGDIIDEALRHINRLKDRHSVIFHKTDPVFVMVDGKLIVQVIINIVNNAIKYTQEHSRIEISYEQEGETLLVHIADNGPGVPDDQKERIFDIFYSGGNEVSDRSRSSGLGLYLCRSIIDAHHGKIYVTDNDPQGAVFTFTLPVNEVNINETDSDIDNRR
ncbi:MAG: DUF4118 domain-containing protein [Solobacterium sp.]|nr:DUF4118 domain-containing protein [Solobacterium sp.]